MKNNKSQHEQEVDYWIIKFLWAAALIMLLISIFTIQGCGGTIEKLKDPSMTQGCVVIGGNAKLGYFNQEGNAEMCKLKCSPELPKGYCYKYDNQQSGCHVQIGDCK